MDRAYRSDEWRAAFIKTNRFRCHYCNRPGGTDSGPDDRPWHIDHKDALSRGGQDVDENLVLACKRCNLTKATQPYKLFREFARAAFWVPDDWRLAECDLNHLVWLYDQCATGDASPWQADVRRKILGQFQDGEFDDLLTNALPVYDKRPILELVEGMHAALPALIAEVRMLRAQLADAGDV